ncbi:DUF3850 domain-containing protein [Metaclostridioides mangenotii]|uniref:DUF3850 domain-containing protein n=1 Tax=Metaclostridioides mangenotii TaxID=1540 RepID=UPI0026F2F668|nr:DUF3850 domain-containing protein [Clostridioides mangenotii]
MKVNELIGLISNSLQYQVELYDGNKFYVVETLTGDPFLDRSEVLSWYGDRDIIDIFPHFRYKDDSLTMKLRLDGKAPVLKTHSLKIQSKYFDAVLNNKKNFEIRKNDRDFKIGDTIVLREVKIDELYTGRTISGIITYITDYEQKDGYVVLGLRYLVKED